MGHTEVIQTSLTKPKEALVLDLGVDHGVSMSTEVAMDFLWFL